MNGLFGVFDRRLLAFILLTWRRRRRTWTGDLFMWMLIAINAAMLVSLLVALWRLHRLQLWLSVGAGHRSVHRRPLPDRPELVHRQNHPRTGLDEFPEENSLPKSRRA